MEKVGHASPEDCDGVGEEPVRERPVSPGGELQHQTNREQEEFGPSSPDVPPGLEVVGRCLSTCRRQDFGDPEQCDDFGDLGGSRCGENRTKYRYRSAGWSDFPYGGRRQTAVRFGGVHGVVISLQPIRPHEIRTEFGKARSLTRGHRQLDRRARSASSRGGCTREGRDRSNDTEAESTADEVGTASAARWHPPAGPGVRRPTGDVIALRP